MLVRLFGHWTLCLVYYKGLLVHSSVFVFIPGQRSLLCGPQIIPLSPLFLKWKALCNIFWPSGCFRCPLLQVALGSKWSLLKWLVRRKRWKVFMCADIKQSREAERMGTMTPDGFSGPLNTLPLVYLDPLRWLFNSYTNSPCRSRG